MPDYTITELDIYDGDGELTELPNDIDKYTNLKTLSCCWNYITSLNNLPSTLEVLACDNNKITSLDNLPPKLISLYCNSNLITSLDNLPPTLELLHCYNNKITSLDNLPPNLKVLDCRLLKYDFEPTLENIRNYNASRMLSS